ncbi:hypothetical protein CY35_12G003200 [Sphagnum magellanicum]|nr:hypothetical protein CY35_12G003200 [Sphagnum magellanicum]
MELLNQLDGFDQLGKVKMIMATNWPDVLDHSLLCPGCLDQKIEIPLPNEQSHTVILNIHAAGITKHGEIDYESIVKLAEGFNGADLQNVCAEAEESHQVPSQFFAALLVLLRALLQQQQHDDDNGVFLASSDFLLSQGEKKEKKNPHKKQFENQTQIPVRNICKWMRMDQSITNPNSSTCSSSKRNHLLRNFSVMKCRRI